MTSSEDRNNLRIALALLQLLDIDQGREITPPYYRLTIEEARKLAGIDQNTPGPEARWRDASQELTEQELDALSLDQLKIRRQHLLRLMESRNERRQSPKSVISCSITGAGYAHCSQDARNAA
jgi:hypothetical protein